MCPEKLKTLLLTVSWKPFTRASVMIITATLTIVAPVESRIMNRENEFWRLNAILFAIKPATSKVLILARKFYDSFHNIIGKFRFNHTAQNETYNSICSFINNPGCKQPDTRSYL